MFDKAVLHLDLDAFYVSVECLRNSALVGKPLIIGGLSARGLVVACSPEAKRFGIRPVMPVKMALRLCPHATVIKEDLAGYNYYSDLVSEVIQEAAPLFEKAAIDEFYLDLTGMDRYFGCWQWAKDLRERIIQESGLPVSFGLAINKLVSKISSAEAGFNGTKCVTPGQEQSFLAPLSTRKIPGIGKETYRKLSFMGVRTIHILAKIPVPLLEREFGKMGRRLWEQAHAIDPSPVVPYRAQHTMSRELKMIEDTLNLRWIKEQMLKMVDDLTYELRASQKLTNCVVVKIRYADFNTCSRQKHISYTANPKVLFQHVQELFDKLYARRQLIRLVGIQLKGLVHGLGQIDLFRDTVQEVRLMQEMDHIRDRFGNASIGKAAYLN